MAEIPKFGMFRNTPDVRQGAKRIYRLQDRLNSGAIGADRIPKVSTRLTGLQDKWRQPIQAKIDKFGNRINRVQGRLDGGGLDDATTQRLTGRLGKLNTRQDRLEGLLNPYQQAATTPTPEAQTPYPANSPAPQPNYQERIDGFMKAMFPQTATHNIQDYMKNALQPARDLAQQEGEQSLNRYMAAKGLTRSGAAMQGINDISSKVNADWSNRAATLASEEAQRRQQNAERVRGWLTDAADRTERGEQNAFDNRMRTLEAMLNQGNNVMNYGFNAAGTSSQLEANKGKEIAGLKANEYMQMPPMSAFPTGQTATPQFISPMPSGPDMTAANNAAIWGGVANNNDWLNSAGDVLGILGGMFS